MLNHYRHFHTEINLNPVTSTETVLAGVKIEIAEAEEAETQARFQNNFRFSGFFFLEIRQLDLNSVKVPILWNDNSQLEKTHAKKSLSESILL